VLVAGQWALVTGATSGIGLEFARQLARRGLHLILVARTKGALESLAAELVSAHGVGTRVIAADLSTKDGIDELIARAHALELPIDHLVGNAGFGYKGELALADPDAQRAMVTLNCEAIVALTRAFLPSMIARKRGGVLNVASTAAFQPAGGAATYAASKAFVLSFTEAIYEETRASGVRAMALCPGPVPTGFQSRAAFEIPSSQRPMILSAHESVRIGLEAYERGDAVCVPGRLNRLAAFVAKLAPRSFVRRAAYRVMRSARSTA
jgi:uncharacterized protein